MTLDELGCPPPRPGLVLARFRDGAVEVAAGGELAEDAVCELGSITKTVTGLLLADAVVRGEVALDTPLAECLPGARAEPPIVLGDLASHTAGLPRLPLALLRRVGFTNTTDPYARTTVPELVQHLSRVRVRRRRLRYSNFGAALLGEALAARAAAPFEQLVEQRGARAARDRARVGARRTGRRPSRTTAAARRCRRGRSAPMRRRAACAAPHAARSRSPPPASRPRRRWPRPSRWPGRRARTAARCRLASGRNAHPRRTRHAHLVAQRRHAREPCVHGLRSGARHSRGRGRNAARPLDRLATEALGG